MSTLGLDLRNTLRILEHDLDPSVSDWMERRKRDLSRGGPHAERVRAADQARARECSEGYLRGRGWLPVWEHEA